MCHVKSVIISHIYMYTLIARIMGPTWGPSGADRTQVGTMLAPWTLLSGYTYMYMSLFSFVPLNIYWNVCCGDIPDIAYNISQELCTSIALSRVLLWFGTSRLWYIHDDVIKWKHFPRYWPFVWGIHRSPVNSPVTGEFPAQRPVTWSIDVFYHFLQAYFIRDVRLHRSQ